MCMHVRMLHVCMCVCVVRSWLAGIVEVSSHFSHARLESQARCGASPLQIRPRSQQRSHAGVAWEQPPTATTSPAPAASQPPPPAPPPLPSMAGASGRPNTPSAKEHATSHANHPRFMVKGMRTACILVPIEVVCMPSRFASASLPRILAAPVPSCRQGRIGGVFVSFRPCCAVSSCALATESGCATCGPRVAAGRALRG